MASMTPTNLSAPLLPTEFSIIHNVSTSKREILATPELHLSTSQKYNGRIKRWPAILCILTIVAIVSTSIAYYANRANVQSRQRIIQAMKREAEQRRIKDGLEDPGENSSIVDEDLVVNNPKTYPQQKCIQPNYLSENGKLVAVSTNGTRVPFQIKGINWFGMETGEQAPFGLWDNEQNGTSVYAIADFLSRNKFNSVRLPLCIQHILDNNSLTKIGLVNRNSNRALDLTNYITLLQTIVKALAYRQISVLISFHTLTPKEVGGLWYGAGITEDMYLKAMDIITSSLCSDTYWNVLGIDLKNEPFDGSWGTGDKNDFKAGAELLGGRMLTGCPKWMAFVEGINGEKNSMIIDGKPMKYNDWYGSGLQRVKQYPVKLPVDGKLVYAPHYYTSAVYPATYFYDDVVPGPSAVFASYTELSDEKLQVRVDASMYDMFGYIVEDKGPAVLFGEFGGLYAKDAHKKLTNQRCIDMTIKTMIKNGYAGGYMWSLNPESAYLYNPADTKRVFTEGLLMDDWRMANTVFLNALKPMDLLPDLKPTPCFT
ncbi:hypothetical protein LEN26_005794 [Aphanomyces euteiches]|nr:hypothetical protein AeMF1_015863 [Aphanomyces euteiches]KAH9137274.1 hypothetical protein LEN26_005794 [Aphanomyces euteiches]KAH9191134.1 hypothetical protein AeNC1_006889 [Aphanomyces euteiches]